MEETILIDSLAFGGAAVGTLENGKRCFVRGGVPGDTLKINVVSDRKKFAVGEIIEILSPSPHRIKPACPYFGQCPGCSYLNIPYELELEWKQKQFERFLIHSKLADPFVMKSPIGAPARMGWRNKIRFTYRDGIRGYLAEDNRSLIEIADCQLARLDLRNLAIRTPVPQEGSGKVTFRSSKEGAQIITEENAAELIHEEVLGNEMAVPAGAFFQINKEGFDLLAQEFLDLINAIDPEVFAELYCGSGTFSLLAAQTNVKKILGIELDRQAVKTASANLKGKGTAEKRFLCGDASAMFSHIRKEKQERILFLVDPPRTGLAPDLCRKINQSALRRMIYVSCGPDTLARDLKILKTGDRPWHIVSTRLVDLFPSTAHFESITLLER
ncbi:MAG: class I SAM-dependent RNA methyltransferase [Lentisphaerae bacterium]|nr:class I SAM-dependent RNA methyltransferase [Lentisphaerota bacterium]